MNLYVFHSKPGDLNGYEDRTYHIPELAYYELLDDPNRTDKDRLENTIAKNAKYSTWYVKDVLQKPFPKGEDAIAKDAYSSFFYAKWVLNGPFPKGEESMKNDKNIWIQYQSFLGSLK